MKKIYALFFLSAAILWSFQTLNAQNKREIVYAVPEKQLLTVAVIQKDAPVQFEKIEVVTNEKGIAPFLNWALKNNSPKTVKRFVVAFKMHTNIEKWRPAAAGISNYDIGTDQKNDLILPFRSYRESDSEIKTLLPRELRYLFKEDTETGEDKFLIVYGMIKKVYFDDGTIYESENINYLF